MNDTEALSLPPAEAIQYFAGKVNVGTRRWDDVWKAAHSRAFMVAGVQADDLLQGVRDALSKAIGQGTTLADFRRDLTPMLQRLGWKDRGSGYTAWRTRLVYETNLRSAYAAGQYEQQTDPEVLPLVSIWRYRHSDAKNPRKQHQAWDGLTLRHDDAWWASHYPPNGWGCGCWVEVLTEDQAAKSGGLGTAPPILRRSWTDPASGRTDQVPLGIDPGWDYNIGASWRDLRGLRAPTAATPPDWPPAAPRAQPAAMRTESKRAAASPAVLALHAKLSTAVSPWGASLTAAELKAISAYRSVAGMAFNRILRGELQMTAAQAPVLTALQDAIGRAVLPQALTVHRGVSTSEAAIYGSASTEGSFPAFVSTSIDKDVATDFASRRGGRMIELRLPAGLPGAAYVQPYPGERPRQYEVLLAPGLRYRVVSRTTRRILLEVFDDAARG